MVVLWQESLPLKEMIDKSLPGWRSHCCATSMNELKDFLLCWYLIRKPDSTEPAFCLGSWFQRSRWMRKKRTWITKMCVIDKSDFSIFFDGSLSKIPRIIIDLVLFVPSYFWRKTKRVAQYLDDIYIWPAFYLFLFQMVQRFSFFCETGCSHHSIENSPQGWSECREKEKSFTPGNKINECTLPKIMS